MSVGWLAGCRIHCSFHGDAAAKDSSLVHGCCWLALAAGAARVLPLCLCCCCWQLTDQQWPGAVVWACGPGAVVVEERLTASRCDAVNQFTCMFVCCGTCVCMRPPGMAGH